MEKSGKVRIDRPNGNQPARSRAIGNTETTNPRGRARSARPLFFVVFIIPDSFSDDFACRHVVFVVNLGPWALERSDLTQSGGPEVGSPPWLKK